MCAAGKLIGRLGDAERRTLRALGGAPAHRAAGRHEARLIELGLAELSCGTAGLTPTGRRALAMIGGGGTGKPVRGIGSAG